MADAWWVDDEEDEWTAADAAATLLTYAIAIAERSPDQVTLKDYKAAHQRLCQGRLKTGPLLLVENWSTHLS